MTRPIPTYLAVLAVAALAPLAPLARAADDVILDDELKPHMQELGQRIEHWKKGRLEAKQLVEDFAVGAAAKDITDRERAIRVWVHGYAVQQVRKDLAAARTQYRRAYKLWPRFPAACRALAGCELHRRNIPQAKRWLNRALRWDTDNIPALLAMGRIHLKLDELDEAERAFQEAREVKVTPEALIGLQDVNSIRYRRSRDEEEKREFASKIVTIAKTHVFIEPESPFAHLLLAKAYKDTGRLDRAIASLEESVANDKPSEDFKREGLLRLAELHQRRGDLGGVKEALKRVLQLDVLEGEERDRITNMLTDLDDKGMASFLIWRVEGFLEIVKNDGIDVRSRVRALDMILELIGARQLRRDPYLQALRVDMFKQIFRMLVSGKPAITKEILQWVRREIRDPNLLRILVHFVYPNTVPERTPPSVRIAAVRALDEAVGLVALPTLYYCVKDPNGRVLREVDKALARYFETRSAVGLGTSGLNDVQIRASRSQWRKHVRDEFAAAKLAEAFRELTETIAPDPSQAAGQRSAPLVDHTVNLVLDNDLPWTAWKPAYDFLVHYWGKDFRPPEQRGKPVEPGQRAAVVKALEAEWAGKNSSDLPETADPDGKKDEPADKSPRNASTAPGSSSGNG